jgi:protein-disulfide isomerase
MQFAKDLNLNVEQFNKCFDSRKYKEEVEKDFEDGQKARIYGTPTFFINSRIIVGPKPFKEFKKIIDKELKKLND